MSLPVQGGVRLIWSVPLVGLQVGVYIPRDPAVPSEARLDPPQPPQSKEPEVRYDWIPIAINREASMFRMNGSTVVNWSILPNPSWEVFLYT